MTRKSPTRWPEWPGRYGPRRSYDPFYQFKRIARDDGKPYRSPEPKAELRVLALLGTKAALVVMAGVLAVVACTLIAIMVARG